jgi:urease gamma subunit
MIKQKEIQSFITISEQWDANKAQFKEIKAEWEKQNLALVERLKTEKVEEGKYQINVKVGSRTTTKYKEVMEGLTAMIREGLNNTNKAVREFCQTVANKLGAMLNDPEIVKVGSEPVIEVTTEKKVSKTVKVA